jgi:hypothetical protein
MALPAEVAARAAETPTNAPNPEFTPPAGSPALRTRKVTAGFGDVSGARRNLPTAAFRHYGTGTLEVPPALGGSPASDRPPAPSRSAAKPAWPAPGAYARQPVEVTPWWKRPKSGLIVLSAFVAGIVLTVSVVAAAAGAYLAGQERSDTPPPPASAARVGR